MLFEKELSGLVEECSPWVHGQVNIKNGSQFLPAWIGELNHRGQLSAAHHSFELYLWRRKYAQ